jgi:epoxyqueuosine reductase
MKILLHICCAPCAIYPFFRLREEGLDAAGYFYNPNIHPFQEYRKRLDTLKEFASRVGIDVLYRDEYDLDAFLVRTVGKGTLRCEQCYRLRLAAVATAARAHGHEGFTTTLLFSKFQKHDLIAGVGREMGTEHGVEFYYEDFRRGWREGVMESKAMGLYRQQYCGCIYSEYERYRKDGSRS